MALLLALLLKRLSLLKRQHVHFMLMSFGMDNVHHHVMLKWDFVLKVNYQLYKIPLLPSDMPTANAKEAIYSAEVFLRLATILKNKNKTSITTDELVQMSRLILQKYKENETKD